MRKLINRRVYDTETATNIAAIGNDLPTSDFNFWAQTLMITPRKQLFLYNQNDAWSDNCLVALTAAEALEWLDSHVIDGYYLDNIRKAFPDYLPAE